MKITSIKILNVRSVEELTIAARNGGHIGLSGFNGAGKSTVIELVRQMLHGSGLGSNAVRLGYDEATAEIELSTADGRKIKGKYVSNGSIEKVEWVDTENLTRLTAAAFKDLIKTAPVSVEEIANALSGSRVEVERLAKRHLPGDFDALLKERAALAKTRRELESGAKAVIDAIGDIPEASIEKIDSSAALAMLSEMKAQKARVELAEREISMATLQVQSLSQSIDRLEQQIADLKLQLNDKVRISNEMSEAFSKLPMPSDEEIAAAEKEIGEAIAHNARVDQAQAGMTKLREAKQRMAEAAEIKLKEQAVTASVLDAIKTAGETILPAGVAFFLNEKSEIDLGRDIDGAIVSVSEGGLSMGEKIKVGTKIAIASASGEKVPLVAVQDASLLDEESLTAIFQAATAAGVQIIAELVDNSDIRGYEIQLEG